ncbi:hypothetical protein OS493_029789 [Desmophyllum pertusum]|uniref:CUB domain-containing protein n=1 Tax=Desmophyllum pertusum TaxID=174260 RepID=A0A9X0CRG2_9CNID|nr:hypothetical protein OS493_029789 [Desmophyllum pertusum]
MLWCTWRALSLMTFVYSLESSDSVRWPGGSYGIPKPASGCPWADGFQWEEGWRSQDTNGANSNNSKSSEFHLDGKVDSEKVNRSFCQYCIYKKGQCPTNLTYGYVYWDDENNNNTNDKGGTFPGGMYRRNTRINFCCKIVGNKSDPILLPTKSPFFLLAYASEECQMVKWAVASLEWIYYDTEHRNNRDNRNWPYPHDAGKMHPTIYYCYYRGCNETLTAVNGIFQSPNYPGKYPDGQYCSWRITANTTQQIHLMFTNFSLQNENNTDELYVYDGENATGEVLGVFYGGHPPPKEGIYSSSNHIFVIFKSDKIDSYTGFNASYYSVNISASSVTTTQTPQVTSSPPDTKTLHTLEKRTSSREPTPTANGPSKEGGNKDQRKQPQRKGFNVVAVVVPVVSVVFLAALFVAVFCYCKRSSDESPMSVDNPYYGRDVVIANTNELRFSEGNDLYTEVKETDKNNDEEPNYMELENPNSLHEDPAVDNAVLNPCYDSDLVIGNTNEPCYSEGNDLYTEVKETDKKNDEEPYMGQDNENPLYTAAAANNAVLNPIYDSAVVMLWWRTLSLMAFVCSLEPSDSVRWPAGKYGIPKPTSGCPYAEGFQWKEGWRSQDTEDTNPNNGKSAEFHLDGMVDSERVNRSFCIKTFKADNNDRPDWPLGQYCIYKKGKCATGLDFGYVYWDDEDNNNANDKGGTLPGGEYDMDTNIYFCCKTVGDKNDPILLPTKSPFFLLAYASEECQMVKWAVASVEWIHYRRHDNRDKTDWPYPHDARKMHPTIYYCYYRGCNETLTAVNGTLQSPNYPRNYPDGQYCSWRITVNTTQQIHLMFTNFSLQNENNTDELYVYDGENTTGEVLGVFYGGHPPLKEGIYSSSNHMFVIFKSDKIDSYTGFNASYYSVDISASSVTTTQTPQVTSSPPDTKTLHTLEKRTSSREPTPTVNGPSKEGGNKDQRKQPQRKGFNVVAVVVPVVSVVFLAALFVAVFCYCKRSSDGLPMSVDNPYYGRDVVIANTNELRFSEGNDLYTEVKETDKNNDEEPNYMELENPNSLYEVPAVDNAVLNPCYDSDMVIANTNEPCYSEGNDLYTEVKETDKKNDEEPYMGQGNENPLYTAAAANNAVLNPIYDSAVVMLWWRALSLMTFVYSLESSESICWPAGSYGIPKPASGCPWADGFKWEEGWRSQDTDDTYSSNDKSSEFHLDAIIDQKKVERSFCIKTFTADGNNRPDWPPGQYCIYKSGPLCPAGLESGYVFWDDDNYGNLNKKGGTLPSGEYGRNTRIEFCCKRNGDKNDPILLPSKSPFFLLAYASVKCQMVKWAVASVEWIYYDTEGALNSDGRGGAYPHDAGRKHPTIYYCYYRAPSTTTTSLPPVTSKTLHTQGESTSSKEPTPTTDGPSKEGGKKEERGQRHSKGFNLTAVVVPVILVVFLAILSVTVFCHCKRMRKKKDAKPNEVMFSARSIDESAVSLEKIRFMTGKNPADLTIANTNELCYSEGNELYAEAKELDEKNEEEPYMEQENENPLYEATAADDAVLNPIYDSSP